ncbi:DUF423 domain-containing protein [Caulobacter segnis]
MTAWTPRTWTGLAAIGGLLAVGFSAFAAHGVTEPKPVEWLTKGARTTQMVHALAVIGAVALHRSRRQGAWAWSWASSCSGPWCSPGSLYAMALGAPRLLGAITPIGGLSFMIGWAVLAWRGFAWSDQA